MAEFSGNYRESFENGYGFSMCIGMYDDGEINCAVFNTETGDLDYSTPVTGDTIRCKGVVEAAAIRNQVAQLPKRGLLRWYAVRYTLGGEPLVCVKWATSAEGACLLTELEEPIDRGCHLSLTGRESGYDTHHEAWADTL